MVHSVLMPETTTSHRLVLAIETAAGCCGVALTQDGVRNGRLLAEAAVQPAYGHSKCLLSAIDWIMKAAEVDWRDLDAVAVSLGPGSFTGLRIGLAAAKGIAFAIGKPLVGIPTLDSIAFICSPVADLPLWCIIDARKQEVYAAGYQLSSNALIEQFSPTEAIRPELLVQKIAEPAVLAGPGLVACRQVLATTKKRDGLLIIPPALSSPRASLIGFLAAERLAAGDNLDPALVVPAYVRPSEAEVNLKKKASICF